MPIDLRSKSSGGGPLVPTFYSGTLEHTQFSSTNPLVISSLKRIRIDCLSSELLLDGVTVSAGGNVVVDDKALISSPSAVGTFGIGVNLGGDSNSVALLPSLQTLTEGDNITISTTSTTANRTLVYSFSEMEEA